MTYDPTPQKSNIFGLERSLFSIINTACYPDQSLHVNGRFILTLLSSYDDLFNAWKAHAVLNIELFVNKRLPNFAHSLILSIQFGRPFMWAQL